MRDYQQPGSQTEVTGYIGGGSCRQVSISHCSMGHTVYTESDSKSRWDSKDPTVDFGGTFSLAPWSSKEIHGSICRGSIFPQLSSLMNFVLFCVKSNFFFLLMKFPKLSSPVDSQGGEQNLDHWLVNVSATKTHVNKSHRIRYSCNSAQELTFSSFT